MVLLSQEQLKRLKRVNVSKNTDKTKERIKQDFKNAKRADKNAVIALSGQSRESFYRVFNTGSANARIILSMAQTLNVSPFYYTGEIDLKEPLQELEVPQFIKVLGYNDLVRELNASETAEKAKAPKRTKRAKPAAETAADEMVPLTESTNTESFAVEPDEQPADTTLDYTLSFSNAPQMNQAVEALREEESIELLHTLFIRAKGGGDAAFIAEVVKRCLLK